MQSWKQKYEWIKKKKKAHINNLLCDMPDDDEPPW